MSDRKHPYSDTRPDGVALNVLGGKWGLPIVRELEDGPVRFVDLQRRLGVSTESLRTRLRQLHADGVVTKERYREVPPRVEYELTWKGVAALEVVAALAEWAFATKSWKAPTVGRARKRQLATR